MPCTHPYVMHASGGRHVARRCARTFARRCLLFSGSGPTRCNSYIAYGTNHLGTNHFGTNHFGTGAFSKRVFGVNHGCVSRASRARR